MKQESIIDWQTTMKSSAIEMGRKKVEDVPTASSVDKDEVSESSPSKPGSKKPSDSGGVRKRPIEKTWKELSETINRELTERSITSLMLETGPVRKKPSSVSEDIKSMNPPRDLVGPPVLKLRFINSPPPTIFTDSRIMGEDGTPLKIELVDASTNTRIHSFFPLDIVLLNADIREEGWSKEEFYRNILRPRKGKRALLVGDLTVTLEHGLGMISGNVAFTGNSRSRKFRLGAKLTQGGNVSKLARGSVVDMQQDGLHNSVYNGVNLLQEDELSIIGFNEFQSGPVSDASDTSATFPASKDYDVVIRHGGNNDFISHLRAALSRRGISVHEDVEETTDAAVPECRVLIIFLTTTYVPSNLLNILQHQRQESLMVYPIFYGISPSDLITNSNYYENFFPQDESERCQAALKEITQMPRYILIDKYESELIDEIVRDALKVIYSTEHEKMIGMDMQIKEIVSLLCIESPDVRSVGIWGAVGIGKTALAEEIFCRISVQFVTCVFLKDLHKEVQVKGQDALREDFLSKVLEVEPHVIRVSGMETSFLRSRVQRKKVLVVLDDVNDFRDVEIFLEELSYLGPGSRIIITSRDKRVFVLCKTDHVYEVKPLDFSKSLQILDRRIYSPELSLEKLKKLRLSHSYHLTKIPRLSSAPNLELLDLEGCNSLVKLRLVECKSLVRLPDNAALDVGEVPKFWETNMPWMGTPIYMSPESIRDGVADMSLDLWSVGCLVLEMYTVVIPWEGVNLDLLATLLRCGAAPEIPESLPSDAKEFIQTYYFRNLSFNI
ncbi:hypothetical protein HID58_018031 [Brassica napus]|uniref:Disease resistance protein n=1 Tax=Brassica napus TaxID=3708 RepID=A0ABQ8D8R5_BRANA|nr:hypothetical protein HID58_018031 [Brassica napus]